ncbi:AfsR/SARP family transcriptional regulator [Mycobacterium sp.]|uniref:AfsR/SARP family transcriptional regulator n=1 Tax=Mycobacterium sp. TaxID=1785 RepID=UPI002DA01E50|nr:BTAD domain-containing putative transcriptional regulator [Mycobacterium sp.]
MRLAPHAAQHGAQIDSWSTDAEPYGGPDMARLNMLPVFDVIRDGRPLNLPVRAQRLVALLAVNGGAVARSTAAERLWPDVINARALASLRATLWGLARAPWSPVVVCGETLMLNRDVESDLGRARALATAVLDGDHVPLDIGCVQRLSTDLLPGWCDEWLTHERERHRQLRLHALDQLCVLHAEHGRFASAVMAGLASVVGDPTRESAHRALMRAHLLEGNPSEAIRQFHSYVRIARSELGISASAQMERLLLEALDDGVRADTERCVPTAV